MQTGMLSMSNPIGDGASASYRDTLMSQGDGEIEPGQLPTTIHRRTRDRADMHDDDVAMPISKMMRWADDPDAPGVEDIESWLRYDDCKVMDTKLVSNVSRATSGKVTVRLPERMKLTPLVANLAKALEANNMMVSWSNVEVAWGSDLRRALEDDKSILESYIENLFEITNIVNPSSADKLKPEYRILEGLYTLKELRGVLRSFFSTYTGSLAGKPPSANWTLYLRLETIWEWERKDDRKAIHEFIDSVPLKKDVKTSLSALFGKQAADQLTDGYEIIIRHLVHSTLQNAKDSQDSLTESRMMGWFRTNIRKVMPNCWTLLLNSYQLNTSFIPLTTAEKQKVAATLHSGKEKRDYLASKPTRKVTKRLLPVVDASLLTTVAAKKIANAWNGGFNTFQKIVKERSVDISHVENAHLLSKNVTEMKKYTIDIFSIFKRHSKALKDEIFQTLKENNLNREASARKPITSYDFLSELNNRKSGLVRREENLLLDFCSYMPCIDARSIGLDDLSATELESIIARYLVSKYEGLVAQS